MYLPRADKIFGSEYILLRHKEKMENGTEFHQIYDVERANWESLDSQEKRCDSENKNYATKCITNFLENYIGCSMGMAESDTEMERYIVNKLL